MFNYIVEYCKSRVIHYVDDKEKTEKVRELLPEHLKDPNSFNSQTEFIKGVLLWFKESKFFTWMNMPKCLKCDSNE